MAMNIPDYRITWVHGIGQFTPDYSVPWRTAFNSYLNFPDSDYIEVLWATVFNMLVANKAKLQLTLQEAVTEDVVRKTLATVLLARATALPDAPSGEWSGMIGEEAVDRPSCPTGCLAGSPTWKTISTNLHSTCSMPAYAVL